MYVFPQFEGLLENKQTEFVRKIVKEMPERDKKKVLTHAADFFGISREKLEEPDKEVRN